MTKGNASISRCIHPVEIYDDKGLGRFHVFGMYWPDSGRKEKQCITVLFPKQVTLSFSNFRSSNQVWNGIPIKWMHVEAEMAYVAGDSPNCAGRSFRC